MDKVIRNYFTKLFATTLAGLGAVFVAITLQTLPALSHSADVVGPHLHRKLNGNQQTRTIQGEKYIPTIWVDPDGCEHWVMDDGWEGYMTPNVNRHGIPVCNRGNACGVLSSDTLFATDKWKVTERGKYELASFFRSASAQSYIIVGHTDSRASDDYNMRLSYRRAIAVADVAKAMGVRVADVRYYGERVPRATNQTAQGRAQNRRVEILCIR